MRRFDGKVALVTGASSGIGAAVADALEAEGAAVARFDRDRGDTRVEAHVARAVAETVAEHGGLDLLAPLAGVLRSTPAHELSKDELDLVLDTNVKGPLLFVRHAVPELRRRGGGAILLAASVMAYASTPGAAVYSASKAALVALAGSLALELAPDRIRVNAIAPGTIDTPMLRAAVDGADIAAIGAAQPLGRLIEAVEVAHLALFLLSDQASAITGACPRIDGGLLNRLPA